MARTPKPKADKPAEEPVETLVIATDSDIREFTISAPKGDDVWKALARLTKRFAVDEATAVKDAIKNWCRRN